MQSQLGGPGERGSGARPAATRPGPPVVAERPAAGEHTVWAPVTQAAQEAGVSASAVRGWVRAGTVRTRTGDGPRGRRVEVDREDVRRVAARDGGAVRRRPASAGRQDLVPLATVEAMERLSGELYLAGQRAARAEAVAELRERRLLDLADEVEALQREAGELWEHNQLLVRRLAVAEAQVAALTAPPVATPSRWGWGR